MQVLYKLKDYKETFKFEREHPKKLRWDDKYKLWMLQENDQCQGIWLRNKDTLTAEMILTWNSSSVGYIESITVLPEYRQKGLGSKLIDYALEWADNMEFEILLGEARMSVSWRLFEKMGAEAICMHKNWSGTGEDYMFFKMQI